MSRARDTASRTGGILQVEQNVKSDTGTYGAGYHTLCSVIITPKMSNSKFLLMSHVNGYQTYDTSLFWERNGTAIGLGNAAGSRSRGFAEMDGTQRTNEQGNAAGFFIDSPNTTSPITYTLRLYVGSVTAYVNRSLDDADMFYDSRTITTLTVMEVAA